MKNFVNWAVQNAALTFFFSSLAAGLVLLIGYASFVGMKEQMPSYPSIALTKPMIILTDQPFEKLARTELDFFKKDYKEAADAKVRIEEENQAIKDFVAHPDNFMLLIDRTLTQQEMAEIPSQFLPIEQKLIIPQDSLNSHPVFLVYNKKALGVQKDFASFVSSTKGKKILLDERSQLSTKLPSTAG